MRRAKIKRPLPALLQGVGGGRWATACQVEASPCRLPLTPPPLCQAVPLCCCWGPQAAPQMECGEGVPVAWAADGAGVEYECAGGDGFLPILSQLAMTCWDHCLRVIGSHSPAWTPLVSVARSARQLSSCVRACLPAGGVAALSPATWQTRTEAFTSSLLERPHRGAAAILAHFGAERTGDVSLI